MVAGVGSLTTVRAAIAYLTFEKKKWDKGGGSFGRRLLLKGGGER
jgi:hypothetical protein